MYPAEATSLGSGAESLTQTITRTSVAAYGLSSKVRALDAAQARLEAAIARVDGIVQLKSTIDQVKAAIAEKRFDDAAKLTNAVLHNAPQRDASDQKSDTKSDEKKAAGEPPRRPPPDAASLEILQQLERTLIKLVIRAVDKAAVRAADAAKRRRTAVSVSPSAKSGREERLAELSGGSEPRGAAAAAAAAESGGAADGSDSSTSPEFDRVFNLCLILPLLGKPYEGLRRYCFAARTQLVVGTRKLDISDADVGGRAGAPAKDRFAERLSQMLDAVAACLQQHSRRLRPRFGRGAELRMIQELLEESDSKVHALLTRFSEARKLARISRGVTRSRAAPTRGDGDSKGGAGGAAALGDKPSGASGGAFDPKHLDSLLEECAYVTREVNIFDFNIRRLAKAAREALESDAEKSAAGAALLKALSGDRLGAKLPRTTRLNQLQQELSGQYMAIEGYFMERDIEAAITLDEPSEGTMTTSMVDDVFYILKKCSERAMSTCDANAASAVVNLVNSLLSTRYRDHLVSELEAGWTANENLSQLILSAAAQMGGAGAARAEKQAAAAEARVVTALNNLQVSAGHIRTLREHLETHVKTVFAHAPAGARMAAQCLEFLSETYRQYDRALSERGIQRYLARLVEQRGASGRSLAALAERVAEQNYELREAAYATRQVNDTKVPEFIQALRRAVGAARKRLTPENLDLLVHALVGYTVKRVETAVTRKRFSFWGGLQFDKDVRKISTFFNSVATRPVRDRFSRLTQMASLLQVDKVEEIFDYWTSDAQVWRLTPREVKKVLALRVEFKRSEIDALKL